MRWATLMAGSIVLCVLPACTDKIAAEDPWLLEPADLGADLASGSGLDLLADTQLWNAADQLIPGLYWQTPALDIATTVFNTMLEDKGITDPGSCPYTTASGATQTWVTNCRSQDGYPMEGTVSRTDGDTDGRSWRRWEFDLEVGARDEYSDLERVSLSGQLLTTEGSGDDALHTALQANIHIGVEDYLEAANGNEIQREMWSDWRLTARYEIHTTASGERILMEGAADLGSYGGLTFSSTDLVLPDTCPNEPDGVLLVNGSPLTFDGSSGCDRCSTLELDGEAHTICP